MAVAPMDLDRVKGFLNIELSDFQYDTELEQFMAGATDMIEDRCGPLVPVAVSEAATAGNGMVLVRRYPVLSVETVNGDPVTVDEDLSDFDIGQIYVGQQGRVRVGYTAGRDPIPDWALGAFEIIVGHLWDTQRGRDGQRGALYGIDDDTPIGGDASYMVLQGYSLPRRAMEQLRPHIQDNTP